MRICELCGARYRGTPATCPLDGGRLLELPDPLLGRTIAGRYLVLEKIGGGGMGIVYRARVEGSASDVAIKFLLPELALEPTNRERFLREAKAANRIDHENIIDVMDFGETPEGHAFLVMEFLQGTALAEEIARGPLGVARSVDIAIQCASALARAHELDVVHRDIKPENIYLVHGGPVRDFVKLLDFGLAHVKGEMRLTASGAVFGTPEYMAPEQARGAPLTGQADLYALGCVLFEMLTGQPPFRGSTPDLILKHMREPAPRVSSRADVPAELDAIVAKLLEKDPRKRHRDGFHLLEELRRVAEALPHPRHAADEDEDRETSVLPPAPPRAPSTISLPAESAGPALPQAWEPRVTAFRQMAVRAYAARPAPDWLAPAIEDLAARVAHARALDQELHRTTDEATERETAARAARLRMGRAIDELGRDESRVLRRIDELGVALGEARARLGDTESALSRALRAMPTTGTISREIATRARDAGALGAQWIDLDARVEAHHRELLGLERERDDLRFQISQLKGRLATIGAEHELDGGQLRDRASRLGADRDALTEELQERALALLRHFASFPELEDAVRSAALPPVGAPRTRSP